ncbi:putative MFS multidrug transporter [Clohesyomyces aquaticus]|uniref:Putative MFS multidrug transporter n=1 Tax=Clohesyomyces aquaticus TaxID=1231657 RepID=A0A1Y1ZH60_9PLEO|nr:putative MFS multidrug transporter [Clohesyomyces aquaticus]
MIGHCVIHEQKKLSGVSGSLGTYISLIYSRNNVNPHLITWNGPHDLSNPFNWPPRKKWRVTSLSLLASFICSMNGTILSPAYPTITTELDLLNGTIPTTCWFTATWGIGAALLPLFLFPIMEDFGIRRVFLCTYFLFTLTLIPVGLSSNFHLLLFLRLLSGGCVPIISDAAASTLSNLFSGEKARSLPTALYVGTYLYATSLGPVVGAAILQFRDWRWIAHVECICTAALFPAFVIGMPETRGTAILRGRARELRRKGKGAYTAEEIGVKNWNSRDVMTSIRRPILMLLIEPVVFISALWAAYSLGTIYLFTQSVEQVYGTAYGFSPIQAGYVQGAIVIGEVLGCGLPLFMERLNQCPSPPIPEARLYPSIIGGFIGVTGGMLVFAWTASPQIHWIAPTTGLLMVGFGTTAVITSIANYLIDAYSKYAASALGAVGLVENTAIAFLPLASKAMYTDLEFWWASSLLGFVSLGLVVMPCFVVKWGNEIRARSSFMKEVEGDGSADADPEHEV